MTAAARCRAGARFRAVLCGAAVLLAAAAVPATAQTAPASALAALPDDTPQRLREALTPRRSPTLEALGELLQSMRDAGADLAAPTLAAPTEPERGTRPRRTAAWRAEVARLRQQVDGELAIQQAQALAAAGEPGAAAYARLRAEAGRRFDRLDAALAAFEAEGAATGARAVAAGRGLASALDSLAAPQPAVSELPQPTLVPSRPLLRPPGGGERSTLAPAYVRRDGDVLDLPRLAGGWPAVTASDGRAWSFVRTASPPPVAGEATTDCSATAADLADDSTDVRLTPEVRALAESLGYSVPRIVEWMLKNVRFEPYWGALKGSLGVLQTRAGNATDQASLLIALLRASNVPARYVRGTVALLDREPRDNAGGRAQRWLGTKNYSASVAYLTNRGGVPGGPFTFNGNVQGISFDHVWVQACVPFAAYRGSVAEGGSHRWVPLEVAVKDADYRAGIAVDVPLDSAFYADYLAVRTNRLPPEFLAARTEAAARLVRPDASVEDVPYRGTPKAPRIDVLASAPPYAVSQFTNWPASTSPETAVLPDAHRHRFTLSVRTAAGATLASGTFTLPQAAFSRFTVGYVPDAASQALWNAWGGQLASLPAGSVNVFPQIRRDGAVIATGSATLPLAGVHRIVMKLTQGEETDGRCVNDNGNRASPPDPDTSCLNKTVYDNVQAGSWYAIGVHARHTAGGLLDERAAVLADAVRTNPVPPTPAAGAGYDATVGELLHLVLQSYLHDTDLADSRIAELRGHKSVGNFDIGLTGSQLKTDYLFDLPLVVKPFGVYIDFKGGVYGFSKIDTAADFSPTRFATLDAEQQPLAKLSIYAGSALEHRVWQQALRTDAVSTVRGLQFAGETGIPLITLNAANVAQFDTLFVMSGPQSMAAFKAALQAEVAAGATVTVPNRQIAYADPVETSKAWRGAVYMTENAATGAYGAIINGSIAGGFPLLNSTPLAQLFGGNPNAPGFLDSLLGGLGRLLGLAPGREGSNERGSWFGDPVNMLTGVFTHHETDLVVKGRGGFPIVLQRWYNSGEPRDGPLGFGWTHSFQHQLKLYGVEGGAAKVGWVNGSGGETFFSTTAHAGGDITRGAAFSNPAGSNVAFTRIAGGADDGRYRIRERNGLVYLFESVTGPAGTPTPAGAVVARLRSITDRNGNALTLGYTGTQLTSVSDSLGRTVLTFTWSAGRIAQVADYSGRSVAYAYTDGLGNLNRVTDALGQQRSYTYYTASDGARRDHRLKTFRLPRGNGMEFEYYGSGQVFRHTALDTAGQPIDGATISFHYDTFSREAWSINERGFEQRFSFDANGNAVRIVQPNGAEWRYAYDTARPHNRLSETDPLGRTTAYTYDAADLLATQTLPSGATQEYRDYTAFAMPQRVKDARGLWSWLRYDARGNLTDTVRTRNGVVPVAGVQPAAADMVVWTRMAWDTVGNATTATRVKDFAAGTGPAITRNFDAQRLNVLSLTRTGNRNGSAVNETTPTFTYDALNRQRSGVDGRWYPTAMEYDALDRLRVVSDALGKPRAVAFDANGNVTGVELVDGGVRIDSFVAAFDERDRLRRRLDHAGNLTAWEYDAGGNVVRRTSPDNLAIGFEYDANDRAYAAFDEEGNRVSTQLDVTGRVLSTTDPNGHVTTRQYWGPTTFDGRLRRITLPTLEGQPGGRAVEFEYDADGNTVRQRVVAADGSATRQGFTFLDEMGRVVRTVGAPDDNGQRLQVCSRHDPLSHRTEVWAGPTTDTAAAVCNFGAAGLVRQALNTWDDFGNKLSTTDALGRTWRFGWDLYGNLASRQTPEQARISAATQTTFGYDPQLNGALRTRTDPGATPALGRSITYARNGLGQVTRAETRDGGGNLVVAYDYAYDAAQRLARVADSRGGKSLLYEWTPGGRLGSLALADGVTVTHRWRYTYDAVGRLAAVFAPNGQAVTHAFDAGGRLRERGFGNGLVSRWNWFAEGSLQSVTHGAGGSSLVSHQYGYDVWGNRATSTDVLGGSNVSRSYTHDALDRIKTAANGVPAEQQGYAFDIFGNRAQRTVGSPVAQTFSYQFDAAHQLTTVQRTAGATSTIALLRWDDNGNLKKLSEAGAGSVSGTAGDCTASGSGSSTTSYTWTGADQLASLVRAGAAAISEGYAYDDSGRRIRKTSGGSTTHYLHDGEDIAAEWGGAAIAGAPGAAYAHGFGRDEPLLRLTGATGSPTATVAHYAQDAIGSVEAVLAAGSSANQAREPGTTLATTGDFSSATYPGSQLVDGVTAPSGSTGWVGEVASGAAATLTLPAPQAIERVELSAVVNYRPGAFVVEVLQGASWVPVASGTDADFSAQADGSVKSIKTFPAQATSGVRVRFTGSINSGLVWLTELEAWSAGASAVTQAFDAWGNVTSSTGAIPTYGYTGREPDATGLVQMRARYYAPGYAQFISRDPLGLLAGINPYAYANGNPLSFNDPDGLLASRVGNAASEYWGQASDWLGRNGDALLDGTQTVLDLAGLVPGFGEVADGANALIYLGRGDTLNAGLSAAAMVPFAGWGATAAKVGIKADNAIDAGRGVANLADGARTSTVQANRAAGDAFERQVLQELQQTQTDVVHQVTVRTDSGVKTRIDIVGRDANGNIVCTECKASATAPLTPNQRAAFPEIAQTGATVVGKGKPGVEGGTRIPPTTINIVRPKP